MHPLLSRARQLEMHRLLKYAKPAGRAIPGLFEFGLTAGEED